MAESVSRVALPDVDRVEFEKLCLHLITAYVRMLEKPWADHLIKGPMMSREARNGVPNISYEGSSVDPPAANHAEISRILQEVHESIPSPQNVAVPSELPASMQQQLFQQNLQDFEEAFPLDQVEKMMEKKEVPPMEMMMIYMRCFRNCLECDPHSILQAVHDEVAKYTLRGRIMRYFSIILADILEICYPNQRFESMVAQLIVDLSGYQNEDR